MVDDSPSARSEAEKRRCHKYQHLGHLAKHCPKKEGSRVSQEVSKLQTSMSGNPVMNDPSLVMPSVV